MTKRLVAVKKYFLTEFEEKIPPLVEDLESRVWQAKMEYISAMDKVLDECGIPKENRNECYSAMLTPLASELLGFSDQVTYQVRNLIRQRDKAMKRLKKIEDKVSDLIK